MHAIYKGYIDYERIDKEYYIDINEPLINLFRMEKMIMVRDYCLINERSIYEFDKLVKQNMFKTYKRINGTAMICPKEPWPTC